MIDWKRHIEHEKRRLQKRSLSWTKMKPPPKREVIMDCEHDNTTYQAREWDTNVPESYTCDDCGKELDNEPDWDLMREGK